MRNICIHLERGQLHEAKLAFECEMDKIRWYPKLVEWLNNFSLEISKFFLTLSELQTVLLPGCGVKVAAKVSKTFGRNTVGIRLPSSGLKEKYGKEEVCLGNGGS